MQIIDKKNSAKRILFYCAKLFIRSLKSGKDYNSLKKTISILIADIELIEKVTNISKEELKKIQEK